MKFEDDPSRSLIILFMFQREKSQRLQFCKKFQICINESRASFRRWSLNKAYYFKFLKGSRPKILLSSLGNTFCAIDYDLNSVMYELVEGRISQQLRAHSKVTQDIWTLKYCNPVKQICVVSGGYSMLTVKSFAFRNFPWSFDIKLLATGIAEFQIMISF